MYYTETCPKCGNRFITTRYVKDISGEHLRKSCGGCGYSWLEDTLDKIQGERKP